MQRLLRVVRDGMALQRGQLQRLAKVLRRAAQAPAVGLRRRQLRRAACRAARAMPRQTAALRVTTMTLAVPPMRNQGCVVACQTVGALLSSARVGELGQMLTLRAAVGRVQQHRWRATQLQVLSHVAALRQARLAAALSVVGSRYSCMRCMGHNAQRARARAAVLAAVVPCGSLRVGMQAHWFMDMAQ